MFKEVFLCPNFSDFCGPKSLKDAEVIEESL